MCSLAQVRSVAAGPTAMDEESRKGQFGWFEVTHVSVDLYID